MVDYNSEFWSCKRNRNLIKILVFSLALSVLTVSAAQAATTTYTILVWGDSLSTAYGIPTEQGWVTLLGKRLAGRHIQVVNQSISGETAYGGSTRLPQSLADIQPDILILELGANDGLRGLDLGLMRQNLATMIQLAHDNDAKVLLLGMKIPPNYGPAYAASFHQTYLQLATQYNIPLVPFFLETVALDYTLMQSDGLHPTATAQAKILTHVWQGLSSLLPVRKVQSLRNFGLPRLSPYNLRGR